MSLAFIVISTESKLSKAGVGKTTVVRGLNPANIVFVNKVLPNHKQAIIYIQSIAAFTLNGTLE